MDCWMNGLMSFRKEGNPLIQPSINPFLYSSARTECSHEITDQIICCARFRIAGGLSGFVPRPTPFRHVGGRPVLADEQGGGIRATLAMGGKARRHHHPAIEKTRRV